MPYHAFVRTLHGDVIHVDAPLMTCTGNSVFWVVFLS